MGGSPGPPDRQGLGEDVPSWEKRKAHPWAMTVKPFPPKKAPSLGWGTGN